MEHCSSFYLLLEKNTVKYDMINKLYDFMEVADIMSLIKVTFLSIQGKCNWKLLALTRRTHILRYCNYGINGAKIINAVHTYSQKSTTHSINIDSKNIPPKSNLATLASGALTSFSTLSTQFVHLSTVCEVICTKKYDSQTVGHVGLVLYCSCRTGAFWRANAPNEGVTSLFIMAQPKC